MARGSCSMQPSDMGRKYIADDRSHVGRRGAAEWIMDTTLPLLARWTRRKPRRRQNDSTKPAASTVRLRLRPNARCDSATASSDVGQGTRTALAAVRLTSLRDLPERTNAS